MTEIAAAGSLQLSGAGALAAATGGLAGILASGRAPAFAQGTTLHWLRWADYVPASDQTCSRARSPSSARRSSASRSTRRPSTARRSRRASPRRSSPAAAPTSSCAINNWSQLYAESVVDVSDVAEEIGKAQGGFTKPPRAIATMTARSGSRCRNTIVGGLQIANRKSWWNEIGYGPEKFPQTWEE